MTTAPVKHSIHTKAPPERAFALFAGQMGRWWPKGKTVAAKPHVAIVVEPRPDGRWFERDADGRETPWGRVLVWEPPGRLVLGWQLDAAHCFDPDLMTEVELTFVAAAAGGTLVSGDRVNPSRGDIRNPATLRSRERRFDGSIGRVSARQVRRPQQ